MQGWKLVCHLQCCICRIISRPVNIINGLCAITQLLKHC